MISAILHAKPATVGLVGSLPLLLAFASQLIAPGSMRPFLAAVISGVALVLAWCWFVGTALNARLPSERRPPIAAFHASIAFCAAYCILFAARVTSRTELLAQSPAVFFAMHLAAMLAAVKVLRFVATNLTLAERDIAGISDSSWSTTFSLFSIWGILPAQRRVNRIFRGSRSPRAHLSPGEPDECARNQ